MKTLFVVICLAAVPLFAQESTVPAGHTAAAKGMHVAGNKGHVHDDTARLAGILLDVQSKATISEASWKILANESVALANRIAIRSAGYKSARGIARDLRGHVHQMRDAALKGDAAGAQAHASQALPFAYQLIEWSQG